MHFIQNWMKYTNLNFILRWKSLSVCNKIISVFSNHVSCVWMCMWSFNKKWFWKNYWWPFKLINFGATLLHYRLWSCVINPYRTYQWILSKFWNNLTELQPFVISHLVEVFHYGIYWRVLVINSSCSFLCWVCFRDVHFLVTVSFMSYRYNFLFLVGYFDYRYPLPSSILYDLCKFRMSVIFGFANIVGDLHCRLLISPPQVNIILLHHVCYIRLLLTY